MLTDCGHRCCDERNDPLHDHFLSADQCPSCRGATATLAAVSHRNGRQALYGSQAAMDALPVIAANDGPSQVPMRLGGEAFQHVSDLTPEEAADEDWSDDLDECVDVDPCNHCPHDNTRHRGDGCLDCGCDVPQ